MMMINKRKILSSYLVVPAVLNKHTRCPRGQDILGKISVLDDKNIHVKVLGL